MYADMMDTIGFVSKYDEEVGKAMNLELARQQRNIELIASENIVSPAVMAAMGSVLTNKYAEGYPGKRYYGGCEDVDIVENIARDRAKKLFGAKFANVQPHSGAQANIAVYFALLNPGDTVMGMNLAEGGHLTHGSPVNLSGKYFNFVPYGINEEGYIDYDELEQKALSCKPKMIVAGASAYPRIIDFKRISEIAKKVGAYLMVDMAHIAGLVAAGLHPSPRRRVYFTCILNLFRFLTVAAILLFVIGNETIAVLFLLISFLVIFMFKFDYQLHKWNDMIEIISQEVGK